ncbi:MAG: hypothetical protein DCF12_13125 [Snowella sp.]|nr:MAG: hypothetical protein DCF12_13125 [Snowella sp.]
MIAYSSRDSGFEFKENNPPLIEQRYWEKIRDFKSEDSVFIDEMAILLGIMREYGRSFIEDSTIKSHSIEEKE